MLLFPIPNGKIAKSLKNPLQRLGLLRLAVCSICGIHGIKIKTTHQWRCLSLSIIKFFAHLLQYLAGDFSLTNTNFPHS